MELFQEMYVIGWTALVLFLVYRLPVFRVPHLPSWLPLATLGVKIATGIGLYYLYVFYYGNRNTSDALRFYDDAAILFNAPSEQFWRVIFGLYTTGEVPVIEAMNNWYKVHDYGVFNDNQTVIRLNALVWFLSRGNYFVHVIIFNFLSFTGLFLFFKAVANQIDVSKSLLWLVVFFVPQVLFWSSGVLKEPILWLGLGILVYGIFQGFGTKKHSLWSGLSLLLGLVAMLMTKNYVLLCLFPSLLFLVLSNTIRKVSLPWLAMGVVLTVLLGGFLLDDVLGFLPIGEKLALKQRDFFNVAQLSEAGSAFSIPQLNGTFLHFVWLAPIGVFNSFVRPLLWNTSGALQLFASIENIAILTCVLIALFFRRSQLSRERQTILLFMLLFVFCLYSLIGLLTPVAGALVRYKIPVQPALFVALLCVMDMEKIKRFVGRMKVSRLAALGVLLVMVSCVKTDPAALVVHNGNIISLDNDNTTSEAMAVDSAGVIIEMGPEHHIMNKYMGERYLDLRKRTVIPTFTLISDEFFEVPNVSQTVGLRNTQCDYYFEMNDSESWQQLHRYGAEEGQLGLNFSDSLPATKLRDKLSLMKTANFQVLLSGHISDSLVQVLQELLPEVNDRRWTVAMQDSIDLKILRESTLLPLVRIERPEDWQLLQHLSSANQLGFAQTRHPFDSTFVFPLADDKDARLGCLKHVTRYPVYLSFTDTLEGSLEPKKRANFQVISHNPLDIALEDWHNIRVKDVFVNGKEVSDE